MCDNNVERLDGVTLEFMNMKPPGWGTRTIQAFGLSNSRNMYWAWNMPPNFGDWIGPAIYYACKGVFPHWSVPRIYSREKMFFTAGSVLGKIRCAGSAIVWGSGIINRNEYFKRPYKVLAVRGPFSRVRMHELGMECPEVFGDPGLLLPDLIKGCASEKRYEIGLIPHIRHKHEVASLKGLAGRIKVIDLTRPIQDVVADITGCNVILSSSLHGLIVSHAYGIPASWVNFKSALGGDGIKFLDYAASVDLDYSKGAFSMEGRSVGKILAKAEAQAQLPDQSRIEIMKSELWRVCPFN